MKNTHTNTHTIMTKEYQTTWSVGPGAKYEYMHQYCHRQPHRVSYVPYKTWNTGHKSSVRFGIALGIDAFTDAGAAGPGLIPRPMREGCEKIRVDAAPKSV